MENLNVVRKQEIEVQIENKKYFNKIIIMYIFYFLQVQLMNSIIMLSIIQYYILAFS